MTTTTFSPGDKVRVIGDAHDSHYFAAGTLGEVVEVDGGDYLVTTDPAIREWRDAYGADDAVCRWVLAEELELVEEPPAANPEHPILIDIARTQALHTAREILGDSATFVDLIVAARFILGEGEGNVPTDNAPAVAAVDTSRPLEITDTEGDTLRLIRTTSRSNPPGTVAMFTARGSVYLTATDIDRIIAYLTALKG